MGRPSFLPRKLNSATHQTDTRPLNPPIPPHRPLLHNHFRFRDGHTYSPIVDPPFPAPPKEKGRGKEQRVRRAPAAAARDSPGGDGCGGARAGAREREGRRLLGRREPSAVGGPGGGEGRGRAPGERAGTHFRRETDPHTHTHGSCARHPQGGGARQWVAPSLPPLTLTRKWCRSSCSREPRFLHAPSLPPSPHWFGVEPRLREGGSAGNEKGGGREIAMLGGWRWGKGGKMQRSSHFRERLEHIRRG